MYPDIECPGQVHVVPVENWGVAVGTPNPPALLAGPINPIAKFVGAAHIPAVMFAAP